MPTATAPRGRRPIVDQTADTFAYQTGEDGFEIRYEVVDGQEVPFSLKPYAESERPTYWCPHNGIAMWFKARYLNDFGIQPTVERHRWIDGQFSPANPWQNHKTREFMVKNFKGCIDPDRWKGADHPKGEGHGWRCQCGFFCPVWEVFEQHQREYGHQAMRSE